MNINTMNKAQIIQSIRDTAREVMPKGAKVILFGSRARGDAHRDSDWDILVLLDKPRLEEDDHDLYGFPFWELGWKINAMIHPMMYTEADWNSHKVDPLFRKNVERDGIVLC